MLRIQINSLNKRGSKLLIQRSTSSSSTTTTSSPSISLLRKCNLYKLNNNHKTVIWSRHQALAAVLLDNLCNNNLIFEQFKKRVRVPCCKFEKLILFAKIWGFLLDLDYIFFIEKFVKIAKLKKSRKYINILFI